MTLVSDAVVADNRDEVVACSASEFARSGPGAPAQSVIEIATNKQKEEQHQSCVEIGMLARRLIKLVDAD